LHVHPFGEASSVARTMNFTILTSPRTPTPKFASSSQPLTYFVTDHG
jgi:hypothetical protein